MSIFSIMLTLCNMHLISFTTHILHYFTRVIHSVSVLFTKNKQTN